MADKFDRRHFIQQAAAIGGIVGTSHMWAAEEAPAAPESLKPIGQAKGIHPGRVVWVHDPKVLDWQGPGNGHWWEKEHIHQERVDEMMSHALRRLTGEGTVAGAWDTLFRHFNQEHGRGGEGYRPGQKILIKPNWVGMIWRENCVDPDTYRLTRRQDYMNTGPQMLIALVRQLVDDAGARAADITICDSLAYLVHEYYDILHEAMPEVRYVDFAGKFGREQVQASDVPFHWSCRPENASPDVLPTCIAEAEYMVNFAALKAHTATGVTLCGKNHFGSLVRWPVQQGYYNMHSGSFARETSAYREQVDLLGHAHLGGKTVLNLIDGLLSGKHPVDREPRRWHAPPFDGNWPCSLLASQDPIAIDSVGFDFLWTEFEDFPRNRGVDDYLHEAALADNPPSGTFYDPDHDCPTSRLASLGVHEHWNNARERQYSRNLGTGDGIELVAVRSKA